MGDRVLRRGERREGPTDEIPRTSGAFAAEQIFRQTFSPNLVTMRSLTVSRISPYIPARAGCKVLMESMHKRSGARLQVGNTTALEPLSRGAEVRMRKADVLRDLPD